MFYVKSRFKKYIYIARGVQLDNRVNPRARQLLMTIHHNVHIYDIIFWIGICWWLKLFVNNPNFTKILYGQIHQ